MDFDTPNYVNEEENFGFEHMDHEDNHEEIQISLPQPQTDTEPQTESATSQVAGKQKGIRLSPASSSSRLRAKCWKKFTRGKTRVNGLTDVCCKHCGLQYTLNLRRNGTNTMNRHMEKCSSTPRTTPRSSIRKLDMLVFREMIAVAIIQHNLPFSFVEYEIIREAFSYANPSIEFWSKNTAATDCYKIYEKEKQKLKEILSKIPGRMCLTTDLWRAITVESYMCLTAHTGAAIAMKLVELLKNWGIEKKVFSITVDNASSNDSMQAILKRKLQKDLVCNREFFHIRCSAHILNSIVQDGLAMLGGALDKIRESVKHFKASESREIMFQNCVETIGFQTDASLVLDVSTRWNSTHLMLSRAIEFKDVLGNLADVDRGYKNFPSVSDWDLSELICELLKPFTEITNLISGSSYPTANLYFMQVWKIKRWLREHEDSDDEIIVEMVKAMNEKFDKYWEEFSDILAIAAVLDPRLKLTFLEYCYNTLDTSTSKVKVAHVRSKIVKLFGAYKKNTSSNTVTTSQVSRKNIPSGYDGFYSYCSQKTESSGKSPLDEYLNENVLDMVAFRSLDVIAYWKDNSSRFKELALMACDVLSIPITTVASESFFSIGSRVLHKYRSCLLPKNVQALICARNWFRGFREIGNELESSFEEEEKKTV